MTTFDEINSTKIHNQIEGPDGKIKNEAMTQYALPNQRFVTHDTISAGVKEVRFPLCVESGTFLQATEIWYLWIPRVEVIKIFG